MGDDWATTVRRGPALLGGVVLTVVYAVVLWQAKEGPHGAAIGWWGWFDQAMTLRSAEAFARGDLSAAAHWYPPGYALLGAPFVALGWARHPFAVVDLACLLGSYAAFLRVAGRCGLPVAAAAAVFLAASFWDGLVFREWVIPWSSTPVALLMWALLAAGPRVAVAGALAGLVAWFRPIDAVPAAVVLAGAVWQSGPFWRGGVRAAAGLAGALAGLAALHGAIHGAAASPYMVQSGMLGFTPWDLGWKAYVILSDPSAWFPTEAVLPGWSPGEAGMLRRLPFVALGLAGLVPALIRGGTARVLAGALAVHLVLYLSYLDLLPPGLWHFNNIHYWKWAVPGYGLLAAGLLRDLWAGSRVAAASLVAAAALACVRIDPVPVPDGQAAKMVLLGGPVAGFDTSYFGQLTLRDAHGLERNVYDFRAWPDPAGTRVLALRRAFVGTLVDAAVVARFGERVRFGVPCWIAPSWLAACAADAQAAPR